MSNAIIQVENLGKRYRIRHQREGQRYVALRDVLADKVKSLFCRNGQAQNGEQQPIEDFWALRDVSFEVKQGEVIGIIGRNGAGKSTLLKILSRITEPTAGRVKINGRVASLLEVGTGFHPELTGRENVFLNGAILGMRRAEIKKKFDEIVAFAEVEKFLDTPVKRYSSGMYVRLAFAVAAHLEPEILIVDEVLAVGDAEFQKKCLGKMSDVSRDGRTILFVSHNMAAVERLCASGIMLAGGRVVFEGSADASIKRYMQGLAEAPLSVSKPNSRPGDGRARIRAIKCPPFLESGDCLEITLDIEVRQPIRNPDFRIGLYPLGGSCICSFGSSLLKEKIGPLENDAKVTLRTDPLPLNFGTYTINISISEGALTPVLIDRIENAASFEVATGDPFGTGKLPPAGNMAFKHSWTLTPVRTPADAQESLMRPRS
jgi:lipopolysaccharide transport system ATP-binding protein